MTDMILPPFPFLFHAFGAIAAKKDKKKGLSEIYKSAYNLKTNILSREIQDLMKNEQKTMSESIIVELLEKHLKYIE
mgnify:CR=1 FL=1